MSHSRTKEIPLIKRNEKTCSSVNIVDDSIIKITAYHLNKKKYIILVIFYFLTGGILYLICFINKVFLCLICDNDSNNFNYIEIVDDSKSHYLIKICFENFHKKNKKIIEHFSINESKRQMENSLYAGPEIENMQRENKVFYFKNNKYIYIEKLNTFVPAFFDLTKYQNFEIIDKFLFSSNRGTHGIPSVIEYNYLLNLYGENVIYPKNKTYLIIFILQVLNPLYIYCIYAIVNWVLNEYLIAALIVAALTLIIQIITTNLESKNYEQLRKASQDSIVSRPFGSMVSSKKQIKDNLLVPGDIVYIKEGTELPCDCLILEGECTVLESDLTGESSFVMKKSLESNNEAFGFEGNEKSILYMGTHVKKCIGQKESKEIVTMVVNTGFNTNRGNLIQNFQQKKPTNFTFYKDIGKYFLVSIVLWVISIAALIILKYKGTLTSYFDNLTTLLPPYIYLSLSFTTFYFHYSLKKVNITCIEGSKLIVAGSINIIVLDKTGTLTQTKLEIKGFKGVSMTKENNDIEFSLRLNSKFDNSKSLNKIHKYFWRRIYEQRLKGITNQDYQADQKNLKIFFTECLACCHCVDLFEGDTFGNSIDKEIYDMMKWKLAFNKPKEDENSKNERFDKLCVIPKNSFMITENPRGIYFTNKNKDINNENDNFCEYKLQYLHRSEFYSKNQSMCVIVRNTLDKSIRLYSKGAPEKMLYQCEKTSIPEGFEEDYMQLTKAGMRVLSCATKLILEDEWKEASKNNNKNELRARLEKNLTFLGLIVFSNKLKKGTSKVIHNLLKAKIKLVIATGDNPYTTISVAKESGLLNEEEIFICDYEEKRFKM